MTTIPSTCVIGTGLTAAVVTHELVRAGWQLTLLEARQLVGGNVVPAQFNGIFFEPHGPHVFHTDKPDVITWMGPHVRLNNYRHTVKSDTEAGLLSWPPQVSELKQLPEWERIEKELIDRPPQPNPQTFETYAVGLMGETLYRWFIRGYTEKQWGRPASQLSSSFAPKRIDLRDDDFRPLFYDAVQGWPVQGWGPVMSHLLSGAESVQLGHRATAETVDPGDYTAVLVTCPLDDFLGETRLEWRSIRTQHTYHPDATGFRLPAPTINCPTPDVAYTRMTETK